MVKKVYRNGKEAYDQAINKLRSEDFESLTKRGRGVFLEQLCCDLDISEYGTSKAKAERLLKFYEGLKK